MHDRELQKPNFYNQYLPFNESIKLQGFKIFDEIRENLSRTIQLNELHPGFSFWSKELQRFIYLYRFYFTKIDHLKLINFYLSILSITDLHYTNVEICCNLLSDLLRKTHLITRDDLIIDWHKLYRWVKIIQNNHDENYGLVTLSNFFSSIDNITEPYRFTSILKCLTYVARQIVQQTSSYYHGQIYLLPLLMSVLPGIDLNDSEKTLTTLKFLNTIFSLIVCIDCSSAVDIRNDLTDIEKQVCLSTNQFESFIIAFLNQVFRIIEILSTDISDDTLIIDDLIQEKIRIFLSGTYISPRVRGLVSALIRAMVGGNPIETLRCFLPQTCESIEKIMNNINTKDLFMNGTENLELIWYLSIFSELIHARGDILLDYKRIIMTVFHRCIPIIHKDSCRIMAKTARNLLDSLSDIYPIEYRLTIENVDESFIKFLPIRIWGQPVNFDQNQVQYHIPNANEIDFICEFVDTFLYPELTLLNEKSLELSNHERLRSLTFIYHIALGCLRMVPCIKSEYEFVLYNLKPFTEVDKQIVDKLFELSINRYSEVRRIAQEELFSVLNLYTFSCNTIIDRIIEILNTKNEADHDQVKVGSYLLNLFTIFTVSQGCLYILLGNDSFFLLKNITWAKMEKLWPLIPSINHTEKLTIQNLIQQISRKIKKEFITKGIIQNTNEESIRTAVALWRPLESNEIQAGYQVHEEQYRINIESYNNLMEKLYLFLIRNTVTWKQQQIAMLLMTYAFEKHIPILNCCIQTFVDLLIHDNIEFRKLAVNIIAGVCRLQKPKLVYEEKSLNEIFQNNGQLSTININDEHHPGDRDDNVWLTIDGYVPPKTQIEWEQTCFLDKSFHGFNTWPKIIKYAINKRECYSRTNMSEQVAILYNQFIDGNFVKRMIRDPRRMYRTIQFLCSLINNQIKVNTLTETSRWYLIQQLSIFQWRIPSIWCSINEHVKKLLNHSFQVVRDRAVTVLSLSLSFDLTLPRGNMARQPSVDQYIDEIREQLLQVIEIYEKTPPISISDKSIEIDSEFRQMLDFIDTANNDLIKWNLIESRLCVGMAYLNAHFLEALIQQLENVYGSSTWHARQVVIEFIQTMIFSNFFNARSYANRIHNLVFKSLVDEQLEVRIIASKTLSGLYQCGYIPVTDEDLVG
ncbi:unnamed protein product [Rotaria sp. Silwood2]|nr:unnamed protein product [Rotaria sp. Silwood2]CAF4389915.1 unnamed protein product [Rotaria sp. Silwood2]